MRLYLLLAMVIGFVLGVVGVGYGVTDLLGDPWGVVVGSVVLLAGLPFLIVAVGLLDRLPEGDP